MCDFCASLTDIDFTVGLGAWNEAPLTTTIYQLQKLQLTNQGQTAISAGDRSAYYQIQYKFWDLYYRTFPAFLPPSINTAGNYALYLEVCAISSVEAAFDPKFVKSVLRQQTLQQAVTFRQTDGENKADTGSFFALASFFIEITREGMKAFYRDPRFAIMHELLPERVHLKLKLSMFVQAWLPYLVAADADRLLALTGFRLEYIEINPPSGKMQSCPGCNSDLFVPEGSYKVYCEGCRKMTMLKSSFFCTSCGSENRVPDNPGKPVKCQNCGVNNRLIQPLFG